MWSAVDCNRTCHIPANDPFSNQFFFCKIGYDTSENDPLTVLIARLSDHISDDHTQRLGVIELLAASAHHRSVVIVVVLADPGHDVPVVGSRRGVRDRPQHQFYRRYRGAPKLSVECDDPFRSLE